MENIIVSAVTAIIVSIIYCKIAAVHTFKVIDGYVKSLIEMAKESIRDTRLYK